MLRQPGRRAVTTLWRLGFKDDRLSCVVYRSDRGLEVCLETGASGILAEPFELAPRMLARMQALRRSLVRRGWQELPG